MNDLMQQLYLTSQCARVFVGRDYSEGIGVKFETKFPSELIGKASSLNGAQRAFPLNVRSVQRSTKANLSS